MSLRYVVAYFPDSDEYFGTSLPGPIHPPDRIILEEVRPDDPTPAELERWLDEIEQRCRAMKLPYVGNLYDRPRRPVPVP